MSGQSTPRCNPLDTYCVKQSPALEVFENYYKRHTGIPGPISQMTRPAPKANPRTTFNSMRDEFIQNRYLAYADDAFKPMAGAPILPGVTQFNAFNMPDDYFTRQMVKKERCGCGAKSTDKKFTPVP